MKRFALLLLAACASRVETSANHTASVSTAVQTDRFEWLIALLDGGVSKMSDVDLSAGFSEGFLDWIGLPKLREALEALAKQGPYTVYSKGEPVSVLVNGRGQYQRLTMLLDENKIGGMLMANAADLDPALDSAEKVQSALRGLATDVSYLYAGENCSPLSALNADTPRALGSAFKLYVLAALAHEVALGQRSWDDLLAIRDDWKSLPSGVMQDLPDGTERPLKTFVQEMIRISDNTATDHLLNTLGAPAVEQSLASFGMANPAANVPFLSTRQMFTLKLMVSEDERTAYVAASPEARRALLDTYTTRDPRNFVGEWPLPIHVNDIEWFASTADLCRVMSALKTFDGPAFEALTLNPGLPDDTSAFDSIAYKGGSEPGVLTMTWLLRRRADSQWRFVSVQVSSSNAVLDDEAVVYVASAARALAAH